MGEANLLNFQAKRDLRGIVASLHTAFTSDDRIDGASVARLVDHCARSGCCGVLVAAVAGEVASLSVQERKELLNVTCSQAQDRLKVVAGISAGDTDASCRLAEQAAAFGVPMVMWQPPAGLNKEQFD